MTKPKLIELTDDQANGVLDVLAKIEERKNGFDPASRTYTVNINDIAALKKVGGFTNSSLVDINGMTLKMGLNDKKIRIVKMPEAGEEATKEEEAPAPAEEATTSVKKKKKPAKKPGTKKGKDKAKDKGEADKDNESKKAVEPKEKPPLPTPEKALSDKNPLKLQPGDDFLVWVGYYPYPRISDYTAEVEEHGFLKKVQRLPDGFEEGSTRIFIAHNEGFDGLGVIIGYCTPEIKQGKIGDYPKRRDNQEMSDANATYLLGEYTPFDKLINIKEEPKTKKFLPVDGEAILNAKKFTSSPSSRAPVPEVDLKRAKERWLPEDRKALLNFVKKNKENPNKFREFAIAAGRTVRSVEYQWYGPMKKLGMHK